MTNSLSELSWDSDEDEAYVIVDLDDDLDDEDDDDLDDEDDDADDDLDGDLDEDDEDDEDLDARVLVDRLRER